jgi:2-keto-3-deoxy-L-fuconate dehydrogenase
MQNTLVGRRVLITQSTAFMGPVLCEVFAEQGATVIASAGPIDVLVANLAFTAPSTPALDVQDAEWRAVFAALVDPLPRLLRAAAPAMVAR